MKAFVRMVVASAAVGLAGCSSLPGANIVDTFVVDSFLNQELPSGTYTDALAAGYQEVALNETSVDHNWLDATAFYNKGVAAAAGEEVQPWDPAQFGLSGDIVTGYQQTLTASSEFKDVRPEACGKMVAYYDGWVEQLREGDHSVTEPGVMQGKWSGFYFECIGGAPAATAEGRFTVYFGFDRSDLDSQARMIIDEVVDAVKDHSSPLLSVVGHADTVGSVTYNQGLSERRATTVRNALVDQGVDGSTITTAGRSESELAVPTADGVREPLNRRVEISISE